MADNLIHRRDFVRASLGTLGALAGAPALARAAAAPDPAATPSARGPDSLFTGEQLEHVAFPMGGIGAGMICLEGSGALTHVSVRNQPPVNNQPGLFAAIYLGGPEKIARVVEGPAPRWKLYEPKHAASGSAPLGLGLPRFTSATFRGHFPFARVELADAALPITARITGWSPFEPGDADISSLPVAGVEYTFTHNGHEELDAVFSFNARNFLPARMDEWQGGPEPARSAKDIPGGFAIYGGAWPDSKQEEAW
ncbi:MAG TPA: GH116 family glycosyl-hydrolase, partial [Opitutaceae bacterium]